MEKEEALALREAVRSSQETAKNLADEEDIAKLPQLADEYTASRDALQDKIKEAK